MTSESDEANTTAQKGTVMGETNRSLWVCPRCFTVITNMEYEYLNKDDRCAECGDRLEHHKKV